MLRPLQNLRTGRNRWVDVPRGIERGECRLRHVLIDCVRGDAGRRRAASRCPEDGVFHGVVSGRIRSGIDLVDADLIRRRRHAADHRDRGRCGIRRIRVH